MCDTLVALPPATGGRGTIFAKNSDRPEGEAQPIVRLPARVDTGPVRLTHIAVPAAPGATLDVLGTGPAWQAGLEQGVNEAGVAIGNEAVYTRLDPRGALRALTGLDLCRLVLERAESAAAGAELLATLIARHGQGGPCQESGTAYWSSFLVADRAAAFVVETSGTAVAIEPVARTRAISNRTTIPAFDAEHRHPGQPVERTVEPRLARTSAVLAAEPVSVERVRDVLRDHVGTDGYSVCMHVPGDQATTASIIAELAPARPIVRVALGAPCRSVYVPLAVGRDLARPPTWAGASAGLAGLDADARARLEAGFDAAVARGEVDDDGWAAEAWSRLAAVVRAVRS